MKSTPNLQTKQCVIDPALRFIDVELGWHDIVITGKNGGGVERKQFGGIEPAQLIVKLRSGRGIAVGYVETANQAALDGRLNVAAVGVIASAIGLLR